LNYFFDDFHNCYFQTACQNVFDFDIYNEEASKQVLEVLMRHGIPINARNDDIRLAAELRLSDPPKSQGHWLVNSQKEKIIS